MSMVKYVLDGQGLPPQVDMQYFKNAELAKLHHVSKATVGNWVEAAKQGKLELLLHERDGKFYIANTAKNTTTIEKLVQEGKKHRNSRALKSIQPRPEFYRVYNEGQIYDIVTSLDLYKEIPFQYNYLDGGANEWDKYTLRLAKEDSPNLLKSTAKLLDQNQDYIDDLLSHCKRVNVVDIGAGNALPVKGLLEHLLEKGILGRYIALDISSEMLDIAEYNIKEWFGNKVEFERYELDITFERFSVFLAQEYIRKDAEATVNLILAFGGTLANFRKPDRSFGVIHDSMGRNDLLLYPRKLDTAASRRYFDFSPEPTNDSLSPNDRFMFDLLNIDESFYDVEMGYDGTTRQRYIRVRLRYSLEIKFEFPEGERQLEFNKGETILLWRAWQATAIELAEQLERNDFYVLHSSQTKDKQYILTIAQVKCD